MPISWGSKARNFWGFQELGELLRGDKIGALGVVCNLGRYLLSSSGGHQSSSNYSNYSQSFGPAVQCQGQRKQNCSGPDVLKIPALKSSNSAQRLSEQHLAVLRRPSGSKNQKLVRNLMSLLLSTVPTPIPGRSINKGLSCIGQ